MVKLEKRVTKKRQRAKIIREGVISGYTSKRIQNELRVMGIGLRRKVLLQEIRSIKGLPQYKKSNIKFTPKKYRKEGKEKIIGVGGEQVKLKELDKIYRMSFIIREIPLHSTTLKRNYLGFRLNAFSISKDYLLDNERYLKTQLKRETNKYCKTFYGLSNVYENFNWSHRINIENPTEIIMMNALRKNNTWIFRVEKEGLEQYSTDGSF